MARIALSSTLLVLAGVAMAVARTDALPTRGL
jgi:hypothetical protein